MERVYGAKVITIDYLWKRFRLAVAVAACVLVLLVSGCGILDWGYVAQPGETVAEGHRRHLRTLSLNQRELMSDIDRAALLNEPSKATILRNE